MRKIVVIVAIIFISGGLIWYFKPLDTWPQTTIACVDNTTESATFELSYIVTNNTTTEIKTDADNVITSLGSDSLIPQAGTGIRHNCTSAVRSHTTGQVTYTLNALDKPLQDFTSIAHPHLLDSYFYLHVNGEQVRQGAAVWSYLPLTEDEVLLVQSTDPTIDTQIDNNFLY